MKTVAFITTEFGDDLIVSFAIEGHRDPAAIRSLTLLRTPKFEPLLPEEERGVSASLEGHDRGSSDYVVEVTYSVADQVVRIKTQATAYELNVRKVEDIELKAMRKVLKKMNYDHRILCTGV